MRTVQQWRASTLPGGHPVFVWLLVNPDGVGYQARFVSDQDPTATPLPMAEGQAIQLGDLVDSITVPKSLWEPQDD